MMSRRDALRSYRRQFRRAYRRRIGPVLTFYWLYPRDPAVVELGRRGDRLQRVFARHDWRAAVWGVLTSSDVARMLPPGRFLGASERATIDAYAAAQYQ